MTTLEEDFILIVQNSHFEATDETLEGLGLFFEVFMFLRPTPTKTKRRVTCNHHFIRKARRRCHEAHERRFRQKTGRGRITLNTRNLYVV
jgi:hypothetical protein